MLIHGLYLGRVVDPYSGDELMTHIEEIIQLVELRRLGIDLYIAVRTKIGEDNLPPKVAHSMEEMRRFLLSEKLILPI